MKKGDLSPNFAATLRDTNGPVDLTGLSVQFKWVHVRSGTAFSGAATVLANQTTTGKGKVEYAWVSGDTNLVGEYRAQFVVTLAGGKLLSYPLEGWTEFKIEDASDNRLVLVNPYCSVEDVRLELKNSETKDLTTEAIVMAINDASRWVERVTRRDFFEHDLTAAADALTFDQYDDHVYGNEVFLQLVPVISITEVKVGSTVLVANTDYVAKAEKLIRMTGIWAPSRPDYILSVRGRFGYAQRSATDALTRWLIPSGLPAHVRTATRLAAAALSGFNRKEVVGFDGNKQEFIDRAIPKTARELLGDTVPDVML
jgi:hypothetical protein